MRLTVDEDGDIWDADTSTVYDLGTLSKMLAERTEFLARLRAFGRDCVLNGDMTPGAERMLHRILDVAQS
ncbi:hypothetical protein [Mycobacteroides abscessus]|uniref:hypothetical protein n=1 Tax=Mycobacteroides abscessus TaxID=36809 RepID=UPI0009270DDB|nr:hypothetical protein [Mycobacteroides abscessus]MBL3752313.1 hypothetical protein [Mycobacteroides abscessus subsp. massiliense]QSN49756.1 hypothetical protein I3U33_26875 [Mycobacteroides abscessus subsp. abscessus]SII83965.1 Uncharacterised protein [Mycobacteroides abscessus subsp. abscessus]SIK57053.1 Uncharacterised protein [Mycobacteroides abscessus subsp. abscessus]SIL84353.1 Uncharacterised protein [Mycobacteroides abscessus subsp. abscessus]